MARRKLTPSEKAKRANRSSVQVRRRAARDRQQRVAVLYGLSYTRDQIMRELHITPSTLNSDIKFIREHVRPLEYGLADAVLSDMARALQDDKDYRTLLKVLQERHRLAGLYRVELDLADRLAEAVRRMGEVMEGRKG